jgi:hypothetical protein
MPTLRRWCQRTSCPLFHDAVDAGADVVVTHGPHVLRGIGSQGVARFSMGWESSFGSIRLAPRVVRQRRGRQRIPRQQGCGSRAPSDRAGNPKRNGRDSTGNAGIAHGVVRNVLASRNGNQTVRHQDQHRKATSASFDWGLAVTRPTLGGRISRDVKIGPVSARCYWRARQRQCRFMTTYTLTLRRHHVARTQRRPKPVLVISSRSTAVQQVRH